MKERTLLDMMTRIDDDFIAEAAHPEILLALQRKKRRSLWVKRISGAAACMLVALGIVSAVPYLRVMSRNEEAAIEDTINAAVNQSQAMIQSSALEEKTEDILYDKAEEERKAAEESLIAANIAAEKAAKEAAEKASAAEKAANDAKKEAESKAAEASKQAAEASKQAAEASKEVSAQATVSADPAQEQDELDRVSFAYSAHTLISFSVDAGYDLLELILPEEMKGNVMTALDQDFWRFCRQYSPNLKRVVIPATIVEFGDISPLARAVEIFCEKGSAAEIFFAAQGYTVITSLQ